MLMNKDIASRIIARNVADILNNSPGSLLVNLGIGIPTLISDYIANENVYLHAENGMIGVGPLAEADDIDDQCINAGRQPVKETRGCVFVDSCMSFAIIRGGHIDITVLGAFEVDSQANVANWIIPGGRQLGVGGAMDLITGAKTVIVAMTHTNEGKPKLVKSCTLPVTGFGEADMVVTELGMFRFREGRFILEKIGRWTSIDDIASITGFDFGISDNMQFMLD